MAKASPLAEVKHMFGRLDELQAQPYIYRAVMNGTVRHPYGVVDGDTISANVDLGLRVWMHDVRVRLFGCSAPEVRGKERAAGLIAKQGLSDLIETWFVNGVFLLRTHQDKTDKYGRWLGELWTSDGERCLNPALVSAGFAQWKVDW